MTIVFCFGRKIAAFPQLVTAATRAGLECLPFELAAARHSRQHLSRN
ncbi:hypothetical protein [Rhodopseudomonas pseudopalustris]|nr:hypothetical protein [Rhodopseudomonas pseudopalustris]MBB1093788.1 hypothetical protein [Rhodopseudomonas palustris]